MNATQRGAIIFGGIIAVLFACAVITFSVMPNAGVASVLPVIVVPPEPYREGWPSENFNWTNTLTAVLIADVILFIIFGLAWRVSKGWTKQVPGRFQSMIELLGNFVYSQCKDAIGSRGRMLVPIVGSILVFLLVINWMKLLPGVESVGTMHCAGHSSPDIGISVTAGHPRSGSRLWVADPLFAGYSADEDDYHACHEFEDGYVAEPTDEELTAAAANLREEEAVVLADTTLTEAQQTEEIDALRLRTVEELYPHATVALDADELERGVIPYLYVVTPYVRGASTDLNLTFGLAIISVIAMQVFGYIGQGPSYFQKFVNLNGLGNAGKRPMGMMDFGVGLFEIISEFGKIISLSFRLFGNMFAGAILLAVMSFLVAFLLPGVFVGLEIIITTIQAYVFAVLTLLFSAQAMEGHHGDDDHEHAADH